MTSIERQTRNWRNQARRKKAKRAYLRLLKQTLEKGRGVAAAQRLLPL